MDYTYLFKNIDKRAKVGIVGATRGYGYTLLAQIPKVELMDLRVICSRNIEECKNVLEEIGYDMKKTVYCSNSEEIQKTSKDDIIIVSDYKLALECGITALVECTGNTSVSLEAATIALNKGINVYMVSKETDSICGTYLNQLAIKNNAVYTLVNGDQPRNLIDLYSWGKQLGLEIIAVGKSSEYDFVWDRETGDIVYTDGNNRVKNVPEMINYWRYTGRDTLENRLKLVEEYTSVISADLCEMNLVSNITGFVPGEPFLSYPVIKTSELADVFIPEEDGGILKRTGIVDVFYQLREKDEASFGGGEFIIIRCENDKVWEILKGKGHVVSKNNKYACIYLPYHFMGLESPISILLGDLLGIGTHPECRQVSVMSGVANKKFKKGDILKVEGHHHSIDGLIPQLIDKDIADGVAPFYLLNGAELINDVAIGSNIRMEDISIVDNSIFDIYEKGFNLD